jgi:hypothetical protein
MTLTSRAKAAELDLVGLELRRHPCGHVLSSIPTRWLELLSFLLQIYNVPYGYM